MYIRRELKKDMPCMMMDKGTCILQQFLCGKNHPNEILRERSYCYKKPCQKDFFKKKKNINLKIVINTLILHCNQKPTCFFTKQSTTASELYSWYYCEQALIYYFFVYNRTCTQH